MSVNAKITFADLALDDDMYYPVPTGGGGATHKLPREMNRHDRRLVLRVVDKSKKHGLAHPYKGRMEE
jgi:hypothetical protein